MTNSDFFSLDLKDLAKGFIVAVITAVVTGVFNLIQDGSMPTGSEWKTIGITGLSAGLAYLIKNWFSNSSGTFAKGEQK